MDCHKVSHVPLISSIILGPILRYRFYGQFPTKMFIHVLILCLASIYAFKANEEHVNILAPQYKAWLYQFMDKDTDFNSLGDDIARRKTYYKLSDFRDDVRSFVEGYYNLSDPAKLDPDYGLLYGNITLYHPYNGNGMIQPPQVYFRYILQETSVKKEEYPLEMKFN